MPFMMNRLTSNIYQRLKAVGQRNPLTSKLEAPRADQTLERLAKRCLSSDMYPKLSKQQVTWYLSYNEYASQDLVGGSVKNFVTNKLASNNPIEDRASEVKLKIRGTHKNQYLFGVFDGHAGCACAQVVSERLFGYISVMISPEEVLEDIRSGKLDPCDDLFYRFTHKDNYYYSADMADMYRRALQKIAAETLHAPNDDCTVEDILKSAFMRLDHDILTDALPGVGHTSINLETISLALSGACALIAYMKDADLYVANLGDCKAVLGQCGEDGDWAAVPLSQEHTVENMDEVDRLQHQHPMESKILRNGRLLGDLAPLRAFGDARYKWPATVMKHILNIANPNMISIYGENLIPSNYKSPPYLTAEPEVIHHQLTPRDKFLVLASDGLWEHLDAKQVVDLVAAHMDERQILTDFHLPHSEISLKEINETLKVRKRKLAKKPKDDNVATHLLRMALGPNHGQISQYLTLPENLVRSYRDDITITVIYFDPEFTINKVVTT